MHHTENDFINPVASFIESEGVTVWEDIMRHIRLSFNLNDDDWVSVGQGEARWERIIFNLKSHKTIIKRFSSIVQVPSGFATRQVALEEGLEITDEQFERRGGNWVRRRIRPVTIDNRKGEDIIRKVFFKEYLEDLKKFGRDTVLREMKILTVNEFSLRYGLPLI